jgi:pimeloyl-ACP methyl ester carboxylesterase
MQPADGELFREHPEIATHIMDEMAEGASQGIEGIVHEASLYHADWGFDLTDVSIPCRIWHGRRDKQAAISWAEYLAQELPNSTLHIDDEAGHFSTLIRNAEDILRSATTVLNRP